MIEQHSVSAAVMVQHSVLLSSGVTAFHSLNVEGGEMSISVP